jgi:hypothetical protein
MRWIGSSKMEPVLQDSEITPELEENSMSAPKMKMMLESIGPSSEDVIDLASFLRLTFTFRFTTISTLILEALKS